MANRQVADTPLARTIAELVDRYGSDEKLAHEVGEGATRFAVMRWRVNGTVPEKPEYVEALRRLGVPAKLLEDAQATLNRQDQVRLAAVEAEVVELRREVTNLSGKVLKRLAALEAALAPQAQRSSRPKKGGGSTP